MQYTEIRSTGELLSGGAQISACLQLLAMSSPKFVHQLALGKTLSTTSSASSFEEHVDDLHCFDSKSDLECVCAEVTVKDLTRVQLLLLKDDSLLPGSCVVPLLPALSG